MFAASLPIVGQWIKNSWDSIDPKIFVNSFKKCLITNSIHGTEDDTLSEEGYNISSSSVEHDIITEEYPYHEHLHDERWNFVFD